MQAPTRLPVGSTVSQVQRLDERLLTARLECGEAQWSVSARIGSPWTLSSTMAPLAALPTAPACARAHVRTVLADWRMTKLVESAELITSELVTNAVQASTDDSASPLYYEGRMAVIHVRLLADQVRLLIEVWDMASSLPTMRQIAADDEGGRGLQLVDVLTARWGWLPVHGWPGKCVWAELSL